MPRFTTTFIRYTGNGHIFSTGSLRDDAFKSLTEIGASDFEIEAESEDEVTISYFRPTSEELWVDFHKNGVTTKAWNDNKSAFVSR